MEQTENKKYMTNGIQVRPLLLFVDGDLFYSELSPIHVIIRESEKNIKFEIKKPTTSPEGLSLSLLDFKVTISTNCGSPFEY